MPKGNVLYITADQWRGDCLSALGHPVVETPTLDRLAADGVLFANHWANTAPCGPSRTTLHTSMYAQNHRSVLNGTPLDSRFTTVALEARSAGWDPVLFGYTDTSIDPRTVPADDPRLRNYEGILPGFRPVVNDPEEVGDSAEWGRWLASKGIDVPTNPRDLYAPQRDYPGADAHGESWAPTRFAAEHTETAFLMEHLLAWLDAHAGQEPWFVHASFIRPHPPYRNPVGYHDRYSADVGPGFRGRATREEEQEMHLLAKLSIPVVGCPTDERDRRQLRATYYGMMAEVDTQLSRLFAWLDGSGQIDDTLVVLTSDHGDQMGDHWLVEKLGYWDESYHVPLIIRDPSEAAAACRGTVVRSFTEHVDVMPTILDWMGIEVPLQCDGRALRPFLREGSAPPDWRTECHWEWDFRDPERHQGEDLFGIPMEHCSLNVVRSADHKYVHFGAGADVLPPLLFDLGSDPEQTCDLAADPASAQVRADMAGRLLSWRMRHDERTLTGHFLSPRQGLVVRRDPRR
ncbi:MAG: alkaline phosphatase family protein [Acidimicrobiales bacterium]